MTLLAMWKPIVISGAIGLAVGSGSTWWLRDQMAAADRLAAANAANKNLSGLIERTAKAADVTQDVGERTERLQVQTRTVYRTILKEVPVYVTAETDRRYPLPRGFVRLLDLAAAGAPPALSDGPAQSDDDPSDVTASRAAGTLVDWAGLYYACRAQVVGWNDWYASQRKAWEAK